MQISDRNSPQNFKVIRLQQYVAEGTGGAQGFFCGGSVSDTGFIDDGSGNGTYTGKPGKILTTKNTGSFYPYSWLLGDNFPVVQALAAPNANHQAPLDLATPIAIPNGNVSSAPFTNFQLNGYAYVGNLGIFLQHTFRMN